MSTNIQKNRTLKRLERQNDTLRKRNTVLRKQIPTREYIKKIEHSLNQFEDINHELLKLYKDLYTNKNHLRNYYWKYKLGVLKIHIKQKLNL